MRRRGAPDEGTIQKHTLNPAVQLALGREGVTKLLALRPAELLEVLSTQVEELQRIYSWRVQFILGAFRAACLTLALSVAPLIVAGIIKIAGGF